MTTSTDALLADQGRGPAGIATSNDFDATPTTSVAGREVLWRLLGLAVVATGTVALGIILATPDGTGYLQPVDGAVARWMSGHRAPIVVGAAKVASLVGALVPMALLASLFGWWLFHRTRRWRLAIAPLLSVACVQLVARVAKVAVGRPRPPHDLAAMGAAGLAFPSGHASTAAALAGTAVLCAAVAGMRTSRIAVVGVLGTAAIAGSRILLGVHWLSDVLAGLLLGVAVAAVLGPLPHARRVPAQPLAVAPGRRGPPHWATFAGLGALVALATPVSVSYGRALGAPGRAGLDTRTVEWLRDHWMSGPVDRAESWWLWHHLPSTDARLTALPAAAPAPATSTQLPVALPPPVTPLLQPPLPGEGAWTVAAVDAHDRPTIVTTVVRPDPAHPTVTAALASMDPTVVRFVLVAGTPSGAGGSAAWGATVPPAERSHLLAAFNSGYRMRDTPGGALEEGHQVRTFVDGLATFGIRADGSATVGEWGRDLGVGTDAEAGTGTGTGSGSQASTGAGPETGLVAARQNLRLIVDGSQPVAGLRTNAGGQWGTARNALPTWRSGVGIDAAGRLVYAAGNQLTLDVLARALQQAGAVRAMELDIHRHMVTFNVFRSGPTGVLTGRKLLPDMTESANRYLSPDQRDFVAVLAR